jgi:methionyl-tRNA formyltransferase
LIAAPGAKIEAFVLEHPAGDRVAEFAARHGIAAIDWSRLGCECLRLRGIADKWLISANSTLIIPPDVLAVFEGQSLNLHPGLLPEYAGLHTHQWAIRNGETEFGVTVHRMEQRVDVGAIVGQVRFSIDPMDTGLSLFGRCLAAGAELVSRIVAQIISGDPLDDIPQDLHRRRIYRHRDALEARIDWRESATRIVDFVRAGNYEPFASPTYVARLDEVEGITIKVLRAVKEEGSIARHGTILEVSAAGPLVACGDGEAIRIARARSGSRLMSLDAWHDYISRVPDRRLRGRILA